MESVNEQILNRAIQQAVYLEQWKVGEVSEALSILNNQVLPDLEVQLVNRLQGISKLGFDKNPAKTQRFREMIKATRGLLVGGYQKAEDRIKEQLEEIAKTEVAWSLRMFQDLMPIGVDFITPSLSRLRTLVTQSPFEGKSLSEWFSQLSLATQEKLKQQLTIGIVQGESVHQLVQRVRSEGGLAGYSRRNLATIVRTAVNNVSNKAREVTYAENSDIVKSIKLVATLDARTTEICMSMDGKVFPVEQGPRPPFHPNCRTIVVPVTRSFKELGIEASEVPEGTRASMDGQVPASMTYPQWLKKQSVEVQNQALGVGKAKLFRQGKYSITKFNGVGNRPISLSELKRRLKIS